MKKLIALLVLCLGVSLTACGSSGSEVPPSLTLSQESVELQKFETCTLSYELINSKAEVVWTSANEEVVTVEDGLVTAVGIGNATVTATAGELTSTCEFIVTPASAAAVMYVSDLFVTVGRGYTYTVTVDTEYNNASYSPDYNLVFANGESETTASYKMTGDEIEIRGLEYGTTAIVLSTTVYDTLLVKKIVIEVVNGDLEKSFTNIEYSPIDGYVLRLEPGETFVPTVQLKESGITVPASKYTLTYETIDSTVASVNSDGVIQALKTGKTTLTVRNTYDGSSLTATIFVA